MLNSDTPSRVMLTTDAVGGIWRYCLELSRGFRAHGAAVTLVVMGPPANDVQCAEARAVGVELVPTDLPLDWLAANAGELRTAAHALATLARRLGSDTVQLHSAAFAAGAEWPVPVAAMAHSCVGTWWRAVHGDALLPPDLAWRVDCVAQGLAAADAVIAPSYAFTAALREAYGTKRTIFVIPNGRSATPLPRDPRPRALTVGRLWDDGKNIALLDAAASRLNYPVRAAGPVNGPNGAGLARRHLKLLGSLSAAQLAREYAQAAVFVSPARYEPFGLAVLEAAQAGLALVLSDIRSFRELWGGAAVFIDPDDSMGLALTLRQLLKNASRCAALGEAARKHAVRYTAQGMTNQTWDVHCNLWRTLRAARACRAA